jgi:asparagine synthase (glutamine-hydrolysing)
MSAQGTDRAVARQAFAADLPRGIVARQGKAGLDSYLQQLLQGNLQFLRSLLLDGELVRQRLLDRHKVEAALASPRPQLRRELAELFVYHLSTEAWINSWAAR